jgi:hypothetical protein
VGLLALTPGITVLPAAIWGTHNVQRGGLRVGRVPVTLTYGEPLAVAAEGSRRERAARVVEDVQAAVQRLVTAMADAERRGERP